MPRLLVRLSNAALLLFLLITVAMAMGLFRGIDSSLLLAFRTADPEIAIGGRALLQAMRDITALGGTLVVTLVCAAVALALVQFGRARLALLLISANLSAQAFSWGLKHFFDRPRPSVVPHLVEAFSASYPSGHSVMAAAIWLTLGGLVVLMLPSRRSWLALAGAVTLVFVIGLSRLYLGVHWPSDVLGGWAFGSFWACGTLALARKLHLA